MLVDIATGGRIMLKFTFKKITEEWTSCSTNGRDEERV
jgi:hypothetical protein